MVAPFAGNDRGIQFFPEIGDEVAVAFEEGDPARPYVIGAMWNGKDAPPDLKYKQIVTKSGNVVRISDESGKESIQIFTPNGACMVQLQNDGTPTITVHSEGDISLEAKEQIRIKCKNLVQIIDQNSERKVGGSEKAAVTADLTLTAAGVTVAADANMALSAGANLDASGGAMTNVVGTLVQLNPPVFVKLPVSKAQPNEVATKWAKQQGAREVTKLKNTYDPVPPRGLAAATVVATQRTESAKAAFAPTTIEEKTSFVEVQMVGADNKPVAGVAYHLELPDGTIKTGVTDENGKVRYDGIEPGECKVSFPELDKDAWEPA